MRKFQVDQNSGLIADILGMYGYYDRKRLAEHVAFINECMTETKVAKHFPGVHWQALEMDLADDFKKALLIKAETFAKKRSLLSDLSWELAKRYAANAEQINQEAIFSLKPIMTQMVHAKPFANSPLFLELSLASCPSSSSETIECKENQEIVGAPMVYHAIQQPVIAHDVPQSSATSVVNSGNTMAFSFAGTSPSVSSSSTSALLNATFPQENNNEDAPAVHTAYSSTEKHSSKKCLGRKIFNT